MIILDANVLVGAHRPDNPRNSALRPWLESAANGVEALGLTEVICAAFIRIVTHPRIFHDSTPLDRALDQMAQLRAQPSVVVVGPGRRHWEIMSELCRSADVRGGHVSDAHHAAVAIEHGATFVTLDRGFGRFPGLRWRSPLDA